MLLPFMDFNLMVWYKQSLIEVLNALTSLNLSNNLYSEALYMTYYMMEFLMKIQIINSMKFGKIDIPTSILKSLEC